MIVLLNSGFRPTLSNNNAPTKFEIQATVTYDAPRIRGTPPDRPRFWYNVMMYTAKSCQTTNCTTSSVDLRGNRAVITHHR